MNGGAAQPLELVTTLSLALGAALVLGYAAQRARLSPIVGYLVAGIVIGPFTPGPVVHVELAHELAEIGVVLLMFGVGVHFHLKDLLAVRRIAIPGAVLQIAVATALGALVGWGAGWGAGAGLVFGLALSVASTVVLLRVLADRGVLHAHVGHVAIGWLIVEDMFTVLALVVLPAVVGGGAQASFARIALSLGLALVKIGVLMVVALVVGQRVLPVILGWVAKTRSRELFTLAVLVIALGIALGSARLFGASLALGAFLAGMVVGQSEFGARAASDALPMRDAFAVVFFVAMGMLFDPTALIPQAGLVAATLAVILIGKPLAAYVVVRLLRRPPSIGVPVALALAQIGEFTFIVSALGRELGVLPYAATQALVVASIVSIALSPLLFRLADPLARLLSARGLPARVPLEGGGAGAAEGAPEDNGEEARAIVVGYGPVGRALTRLLVERGVQPTVIELNHETAREVRARGIRALHGDASQVAILEEAGARTATSLVFSASGSPADVIRAVRDVAPSLPVLTRATYAHEVRALQDAGADVVVTAEASVAVELAERILKRLGASRKVREGERDRILADLLPS